VFVLQFFETVNNVARLYRLVNWIDSIIGNAVNVFQTHSTCTPCSSPNVCLSLSRSTPLFFFHPLWYRTRPLPFQLLRGSVPLPLFTPSVSSYPSPFSGPLFCVLPLQSPNPAKLNRSSGWRCIGPNTKVPGCYTSARWNAFTCRPAFCVTAFVRHAFLRRWLSLSSHRQKEK
jgi:hypothetical protein